MTLDEAEQQVAAFFGRLGSLRPPRLGESRSVAARIGEAVIGFEYDESASTLSAQALIYRFRREPRDEVLDAVFARESEENAGGGRVVFDSGTNAFYLQRDFTERVGENVFYDGVNRLALASLRWNGEILAKAAGSGGEG